MKNLSIICAFTLVLGLMSCPAFAIEYAIDFLESGNPGGSASLKTFDEEWWMVVCQELEVELDIWIDVEESLLCGGFWINYDSSKVSLVSVEVYDGNDLPGPWDPTMTYQEQDPGGRRSQLELRRAGDRAGAARRILR